MYYTFYYRVSFHRANVYSPVCIPGWSEIHCIPELLLHRGNVSYNGIRVYSGKGGTVYSMMVFRGWSRKKNPLQFNSMDILRKTIYIWFPEIIHGRPLYYSTPLPEYRYTWMPSFAIWVACMLIILWVLLEQRYTSALKTRLFILHCFVNYQKKKQTNWTSHTQLISPETFLCGIYLDKTYPSNVCYTCHVYIYIS